MAQAYVGILEIQKEFFWVYPLAKSEALQSGIPHLQNPQAHDKAHVLAIN